MISRIYFITGTTGFLGGEFLQTVLEQDPQAQCYCLIRNQGQLSAAQRIQHSDRVFAVPGDITLDNLGLSEDEYQALAEKVTHVVHVAAMVKFEKPKEVLEKINVRGTENVLRFAQQCQNLNPAFQVLGHVGTAYVAGKRKGLVTEKDFSDAYGFKNNYESTKFAAEALLHAAKATLPIMIFRPSIILGNSAEGRVSRSNVIFPLVKVAKKDPLGLAPFNKHCLIDFVSVDYVAKGMYFLLQEKAAVGQVFHLTSGVGNEVTVQKMLHLFNEVYKLNLSTIPTWLWPILRRIFSLTRHGRYFIKGVEPYWLYTVDNPQFCQQFTKRMLDKHQFSIDNSKDFLLKTLVFMDHQFF
ncbi:MAG: SDR family oxidoreductase [Gammaproteobacteria bacterium]